MSRDFDPNVEKNSLFGRLKEPLKALTVWIAILSLLATIHADVFEQEEDPLSALIMKPLERIRSSATAPVPLSSLLTPATEELEHKDAIYVFALDVSESMKEQQLSALEINQYRADVRAKESEKNNHFLVGCFPPAVSDLGGAQSEAKRPEITGFDIARAELCRYIESLPDGSRVALWTFCHNLEIKIPTMESQSTLGNKYLVVEKTREGGTTKGYLYAAAKELEAKEKLSNFRLLLDHFSRTYHEEIQGDEEIRFVIISDFAHDIGGGKYLLDDSDSARISSSERKDSFLWRSVYRASASIISNQFRELSGGGATFHLARVVGAQKTLLEVLPIVGDTLEWIEYRESHVEMSKSGERFDFLRAYVESANPVIFYYTPGNFEPIPTTITVGDERFRNSTVKLALASETDAIERHPLKIKISNSESQSDFPRSAPLGLGTGDHLEEIGGAEHTITLQPLSTLESREASSYRLILSWKSKDSGNADPLENHSFAARVIFYRRLSSYGAASMVISLFFIAMSFLWSIVAIIQPRSSWRRIKNFRREKIPSESPDSVDPSGLDAPDRQNLPSSSGSPIDGTPPETQQGSSVEP